MSDAYGLLLGLHLPAAFLALATFWGAVLARKGGRLHRRFGRLFVGSMVVTAATAALMCLMLMADPLAVRPPADPADAFRRAQEGRELGSGLLEVSLATLSLLHFGKRALGRRTEGRAPRDLVAAGSAVAVGMALWLLGFHPDLPYLEGNGVFVAMVGGLELRGLLRRVRRDTQWLAEHLFGMVGAGGIAHGAATVNLAGFFTDDLGLAFAWSGPVVLLFAVGGILVARRYARRVRRHEVPIALQPRAFSA